MHTFMPLTCTEKSPNRWTAYKSLNRGSKKLVLLNFLFTKQEKFWRSGFLLSLRPSTNNNIELIIKLDNLTSTVFFCGTAAQRGPWPSHSW